MKSFSALKYLILSAGLLLCSMHTFAGVEIREFKTDEQRQLYHHLVDELRCLVCQNQNLADSNAPLAFELRDIIYEKIQDGKNDQEVIDFMVARYGKFVLYNPPLDVVTFFLWFGPFIMLLVFIYFLFNFIRKRSKAGDVNLSSEQHQRAKSLLDTDGDAS